MDLLNFHYFLKNRMDNIMDVLNFPSKFKKAKYARLVKKKETECVQTCGRCEKVYVKLKIIVQDC